MVSVAGVGREDGLRERKKRQTRYALIDAALRLFAEHGYEHTTTEQIAAEANVSQRTLFRYFANKDDIALAPMDALRDAFLAAVTARPPAEPPMTALLAAARVVWRGLGSGDTDEPDDPARVLRVINQTMDLIHRTPALLAASLRNTAERENRLTEVIARREGIDPVADPRPRLAVTCFDAALRVATECWHAGNADKVLTLIDDVETCVEAMPSLFAPWRPATPLRAANG